MSLNDRKKRRQKQTTRNILIIVLFLAVAGLCGGFLLHDYWQEKQNEEMYESLRTETLIHLTETETEPPSTQAIAETTEEAETDPVMELVFCEPEQDFVLLQETNPDIYAWISVPGTAVDYPILQSETDNYYLDHNLDLSQGYPGCIYSNICNNQKFSDYHTVLYGHNLTRDRMFGSLHRFEEESFFEENRKILIYTPDRRLTYEVLAAVVYTDQYIPYYYNLYSYEGTAEFWESVASREEEEDSHVLAGVELTEVDKLLTLSTCIRNVEGKRYLVVGRLVEEAFYLSDPLDGIQTTDETTAADAENEGTDQ